MKKSVALIFLILFFQFSFFQSQSEKCPPPKFKKGQTSAQVNEETRIYIACVKEFRAEQKEAQDKEKEKKLQEMQQQSRIKRAPDNRTVSNSKRQKNDTVKAERNR